MFDGKEGCENVQPEKKLVNYIDALLFAPNRPLICTRKGCGSACPSLITY